MLSLRRRSREWLFVFVLAIFAGAMASVPVLQWLLPGNFLVSGIAAILGAVAGLRTGYELWDRWFAAPRRPVMRPAAPTSRTQYLNDLIERLRAEEDQYVPLAGDQAPYEGYDADYSSDARTEMLREYQDIGEALADEEHRRFVIIGAPGAGKTTTLRMLALAVARARPEAGGERNAVIRALYDDDGSVPLPLWVNLGWGENPPDAEKLLRTWWSEVEKLDGSVTDAMRSRPVWLFLDGLNEMPERNASREEQARDLRNLFAREEFAKVRLVVTCREHDYAGDMRLGLPVVRVRPLDDTRVEAFAHYRLGKKGAPGFLDALGAQPHLRELARNPYTLVRLIAVYNEKEPLPETLEALHEQHTRVRYAHEKEYGRVTVPLPRLERKLQRMAFRMIAAGKGTSTDEAWAQRRIGRLALEDAFQLNLLVADKRTGALSFYHQTLHQYFALPGLSGRLARGRAGSRVRFIRQIADLGEGGAPAVPVLIKAFQTRERAVMDAVLVALSRIDRAVFSTDWQQLDYEIPPLSPQERAEWARDIADTDVRPGVGVKDGLPDIDWVEIPEGEFIYQDGRTLTLPTFYISRYPITYAQFRAFIDAEDGFYNDVWWRGLAKRGTEPGEQHFKYDNHPRERVSWYDAVAFCRWLSARVEALTPNPSPSWRGESSESEARFREMATQTMRDAARDLRRRQMDAEALLWECLRDRRLGGVKFRRQHPVANTHYVVDFFSYESGLAIELDGPVHERHRVKDAARQQEIEALGWRVLRLKNEQIFNNLEWALAAILQQISPLPEGEGPGVRAKDRLFPDQQWMEATWNGPGVRAEIRLPTEQEWEKAARGADGRLYPYGDDFNASKGNVRATGIGQTSAVGIFPQGASPYGVLDMSGNVWEWCLNEWANPENTGLAGNAARVLRGGSWFDYLNGARCAYRAFGSPHYRGFLDGGFRVCASPFSA